MDGFDATPAELRFCGLVLADLSQELRSRMGVLQGEVATVPGGTWQGAAARGFARGWEQWQAGAREVLDALNQLGTLLHDSGRDYGVPDDRSAEALWRCGEGL